MTSPIVYVEPTSEMMVKPGHPFVDPSGLVTSLYLDNWLYPGSSLRILAEVGRWWWWISLFCRDGIGNVFLKVGLVCCPLCVVFLTRWEPSVAQPLLSGSSSPPSQDLAISFGTDPPLYTKPPNWMATSAHAAAAAGQARPPAAQQAAQADPAAFHNPLMAG